MLPLAALVLQSVTSEVSPTPVVTQTSPTAFAIQLGSQSVLRGSYGAGLSHELSDAPAQPLYLGYPHGPKTAEFVPAGRQTQTLIVKLNGPLDASVRASADSFACSDRTDTALGSAYGNAASGLNNGVYDRKGDWLLTAEGTGVRIDTQGKGRYRLRASGACTLRLRTSYYRDHLGYFLWDQTKPLWTKPVAGWCSWMAHLQDVTENDVLAAARFFSANLKDYGYDVIQIDDGYQRVLQFPKGEDSVKEPFSHYWSIPNEKFPSGLKTLASQIDSLGMTPGIWIGEYLPLGLKHADGYVKGTDSKPHKGPWVNYAMNALMPEAREEAYIDTIRELRAEGWRYFKIDTLRHVLYDSYRQVPDYWKGRGESMETAFRTLLSEAKKAAGAENYLMACWGTMPELAGIPDGARIGEDVSPDVASMRRAAKYVAQFQYLNNVVWRNDPDYMCLRVPVEQAQAWATLTFLAGGHVMVSDPIKDYDPARVDVLRRVGPPLVTKPTVVVPHGPDPEIVTLNAEKAGDHWTVAARFAWSDLPARQVPLAELGLDPAGHYLAFDFWKERYLGTVTGSLDCHGLAAGACQAVSLRPLQPHPQVLGTNRHLGQGAHELERIRWSDNTLSGRFRRSPGREWSVYVHIPNGWKVQTASAKAERDGEVLKLTFPAGKTAIDWKVTFAK